MVFDNVARLLVWGGPSLLFLWAPWLNFCSGCSLVLGFLFKLSPCSLLTRLSSYCVWFSPLNTYKLLLSHIYCDESLEVHLFKLGVCLTLHLGLKLTLVHWACFGLITFVSILVVIDMLIYFTIEVVSWCVGFGNPSPTWILNGYWFSDFSP